MTEDHAATRLLNDVLPQFFPAHWLDGAPDIVHSDFPSRIRLGYVRRIEGGYSFVMRPTLEGTDITIAQLHESALRNLDALPMPGLSIGQTPGGPEAYLGDVEDNFRAARILLPRVQCVLCHELGPEFFASIPCRDWFICWSKDQSLEWQTRNFEAARKDFLEDEYNLTPDILLMVDGNFSLHRAQS